MKAETKYNSRYKMSLMLKNLHDEYIEQTKVFHSSINNFFPEVFYRIKKRL